MAEQPASSAQSGTETVSAPDTVLDSGTYEIIRQRLNQSAKSLQTSLDALNSSRKALFGAIDTLLLGSERIATRNNCIPRDMASFGNNFIFGYNVHLGLKSTTELADVFSIYTYSDRVFKEKGLDILNDPKFIRDFQEMYKYYKETRLAKLTVLGNFFYMIFQIGKEVSDNKVFKWHIQGDILQYIDNRSAHEVSYPPQHEFEWKRVGRESYRTGKHPHISIEDRVFVETIEGDLTVKVEDNTDTGKGIYSEPVENKDQSLDDAEVLYTIIGNLILLKLRPYQEPQYRHLIFNEKTEQVVRIDSIGESCILLPENHGIIFSNGYYLQTGDYKFFDTQISDTKFESKLAAPNGEDYQYVFYNQDDGVYVLLSYNCIDQKIDTPLICHGYSYFETGEMLLFKAEPEPRNNHVIQIWQTPFCGPNYSSAQAQSDSILYKIGNKDIVRCMSECRIVQSLLNKDDTYSNLYIDITRAVDRIIDSYFWIDKQEGCDLGKICKQIRTTSSGAIEEFEKVSRLKRSTRETVDIVSKKTEEILSTATLSQSPKIETFVQNLSRLRSIRGEIISLRDLRYTDLPLIEQLEQRVKARSAELSEGCIAFLLTAEGLTYYTESVSTLENRISSVQKTTEGAKLDQQIVQSGKELELLLEIVSNLKIDDPTQATQIIEKISTIYSDVNRIRSSLRIKCKDLRNLEGAAEFRAQMKLLEQAVANYIDISDTPERCDEYYTKILVQVEELEGRFADYDEFIPELAQRRTDIHSTFESKKAALQEQRSRTCNSLFTAAERILKGIENRLKTFTSQNEINGFLASDLMVEKVRDLAERLVQSGDPVKADELQGKLKSIREDASRQLRDKTELFEDGDQIIRLGSHRFSVTTQASELTIILKDNQHFFHISGTDFFEPVVSEELEQTRDVWNQDVISENSAIYRAEYLAWQILKESLAGRIEKPGLLCSREFTELTAAVTKFMSARYEENYQKGVHDHDAALLLKELLSLHQSIDLLTYSPQVRALAFFFWISPEHADLKKRVSQHVKGLYQALKVFNGKGRFEHYVAQLEEPIRQFCNKNGYFDSSLSAQAAGYLCEEIRRGDRFIISNEADSLCRDFISELKGRRAFQIFTDTVSAFGDDSAAKLFYTRDWLQSFLDENDNISASEFIDESALLLSTGQYPDKNVSQVINVSLHRIISGFRGDHAVINGGQYQLVYSSFTKKLIEFETNVIPKFLRYKEIKKDLVDKFKSEIKIDDCKPKVLSSFVRSKLINDLYLPLIGDNLAKQIGASGVKKRTDLMGLLLLISPPGYGKTTLMEYVASRLGVIFMKINGPALGNRVVSLDPAEAPNASAREELQRLNLALQMGNNVMIYVDDIQHCSPEFLEKFISLCDAQRKIEGVYKGNSRTYDLRGKKVIVVMAGNPYTESGERFKVPDMLANRADTYNLGDMLNANEEAFKLSYLENALTSNPVLAELTNRSQRDFYSLVKIAESGSREGIDLEGEYSAEQLNDITNVLKKLSYVRDIVLKINQEYIRSAAQANEYRTEPPFKLQGSYRNMNRISERVLPVINDKELFNLILRSYENDAQTLTTGAEANLLKWKELTGALSPAESDRWQEIKKTFNQHKLVKADDKLGQAILMLGKLEDALCTISTSIEKSKKSITPQNSDVINTSRSIEILEKAINGIGDALIEVSKTSINDQSVSALVPVLENQINVMKEWLIMLQNTSEKHAGNIESLQTAINRSLWFQRELVSRFLKEGRAQKVVSKSDTDSTKETAN